MRTATILNPVNEPVSVPVAHVVEKLKGYLYERRRAIVMYPNAAGATEKLQAIEEALYTLDRAAVQLNPNQTVKMILRTALTMHYIAPHATRKLHQTWYNKVELLMNGCREYLGWRAQV
jgi:hypothetical protein